MSLATILNPPFRFLALKPILQILILGVRILDAVVPLLQNPQLPHHSPNQAPLSTPIPRTLPPHRTPQPLTLQPPRLLPRHLHRIVRHQMLLNRIIAIRSAGLAIPLLRRPHQRQRLEIKNPILPTPFPNPAKRPSQALRLAKRPPVQRHPKHDLVPRDTLPLVVPHRALAVERRRVRVLPAGEDIRLMPCLRVPRPGIVVRHQVPEIKIPVHATDIHLLVVLRAGRTRYCQFKVVLVRQGRRVGVHGFSACFEEQDEVGCFGWVLGVFPIDINAIEPEVLDEFYGGRGEFLSAGCAGGGDGEVGGVGPAADGEEDLQGAVLLF